MKKTPLIFLLLFTVLTQANLNAQTDHKADSLLQLIENARHDTIKIQQMLKLTEHYVSQPEKHILWAQKIADLSKKINYRKGIGQAHAAKGLYYTYRGDYADALVQFDSALVVFQDISDKRSEVSVLGNTGNIHAYLGNYNEALTYYLEALTVMEELGDKNWIATANNNIGNIYYLLDDPDNAMIYYQKALKVYREISSNQGIALALGNIGIIYNSNGNTDQAIIHLLEAIEYGKKTDDIAQLAGNYTNLASAFGEKKMYDEAIIYYDKAIEIFEKLEDKNGLSMAFLSISQYYIRKNEYQNASIYAGKAKKISREIDARNNLMTAYRHSARIDSAQSNFFSAYENLRQYTLLRDTIFEADRTKQIAEMQTRFNTQAKEKENLLLKEKQAKQEAVIKRKNYLTWFIVSVLFFVGILAYLALRNSKQQKRANQILSQKNTQINQQKEEIQAQTDNLEKANAEISETNRLLHETNEKMTASINYAGRIQNAMLPGAHILEATFKEHFIMYYPKDIVSGDFFWIKNSENYLYFATADCTGHGVPGAMVSMLGISFLNEIIAHKPDISSDNVLKELRKLIKDSLERGNQEGRRDGLDIALCRWDKKRRRLQYSGAHCPLYIYSNGKLKELAADRMPIGKHRKEPAFSAQEVQLAPESTLYMFSDGITDQFGGKFNQKFKKMRLKALLQEVHTKPLSEQKQIIESTFFRWKGNTVQLDDILLLGLKL